MLQSVEENDAQGISGPSRHSEMRFSHAEKRRNLHAISDMPSIVADQGLPVKRFLQRINVETVRDAAIPIWMQLNAAFIRFLIRHDFGWNQ